MAALFECHDRVHREHREARLHARQLHHLLHAAGVDVRSIFSELQPPRAQTNGVAGDVATASTALPAPLLAGSSPRVLQALRRSRSVTGLSVDGAASGPAATDATASADTAGSESDLRLARSSSTGAVALLTGAGSRVGSTSHLAEAVQVRVQARLHNVSAGPMCAGSGYKACDAALTHTRSRHSGNHAGRTSP